MSGSGWARLLGLLFGEFAAIVMAAALCQLFLREARTRRMVWQAAFASMALVLAVEFSGLRERFSFADYRPHHHFVFTTAAPIESERPTSVVAPHAKDLPNPPTVAVSGTVAWPGWVWLAGVAFFLTRSVGARICLTYRRRRAANAEGEVVESVLELQKALRLNSVEVKHWPELRSPVAFGVFRPTVALPKDFGTRFSLVEQRAMLAHEMAHLAARDPLWLMAGDLVIGLLWWHPLVWWARNRLRSASEAAADEASALIPGGPHVLAECLVRFGRELAAAGPVPSMGVAGNGRRSDLAARIEQLLGGSGRWRSSSIWVRWAPSAIACLVGVVVAALPLETGLGATFLAMFAIPARTQAQDSTASNIGSPKTNGTVAPAVEAIVSKPEAAIQPSNGIPASDATTTGTAPYTYQWNSKGTNSSTTVVARVQPSSNSSPEFGVNASGSGPLYYQWYLNGTNLAAPTINVTNASAPKGPPKIERHKARVKLQVEFVEMTEADSKNLGIDWIFGTVTNDPAPKTSHNWDDLLGTIHNRQEMAKVGLPQTNTHAKNVTIEELRSEGQTVVLKSSQFAALRARMLSVGSDLLAAPEVVCFSGNQAHVAMEEVDPIVTGVDATTNPPGINYFTDNAAIGESADIAPELTADNQWRVVVLASVVQFLRYDDPGKFTPSVAAPGVKPIKGVLPLPRLRKIDAVADDTVPPDSTLVIRGPQWTETTKTKSHFLFFRSSSKSVSTRQRLYIFITATNAGVS